MIAGEVGILGLLFVLVWFIAIDRINYKRLPNIKAVIAMMMGISILTISLFDHYLWSNWAGLALVVFVAAMLVRMGEEKN